jgi:hypothetical protein
VHEKANEEKGEQEADKDGEEKTIDLKNSNSAGEHL